MQSTSREIRNILKSHSFYSDKQFSVNEKIMLQNERTTFIFEVIHKCDTLTYSGYHYVLKPTFNTNFRIS